MEVIRATAMGMCFGVRDALAAMRAVATPGNTTIHGELVHNPLVRRELAARGFQAQAEDALDGEVATPAVLITAHGISDRERARLRDAGHELIDTTCPLVVRAHHAARDLAAEGRHVVVIGKRGHVEVRGLVGDLPSFSVVSHLSEVERYATTRIGVVCQTTVQEAEAERLVDALVAANPQADVAVRDTICEPTKQRVRALRSLLPQVDAVVVVGGRNSNNTRQLAFAVTRGGRRAIHVEDAEGITADALAGCRVVGLTAGTSTLDATIDAVEQALRAIPAADDARDSGRPGAA